MKKHQWNKALAILPLFAIALPQVQANGAIRLAASSSQLPLPAPVSKPRSKPAPDDVEITPESGSAAASDAATPANDDSLAGPLPDSIPSPSDDIVLPPDTDWPRGKPPVKKPSVKPKATRKKSIKRIVASRARVGGVLIGARSDALAVRSLRRALMPRLRAPVALSDGEHTFVLRRDQLGASIPLARLVREARRVNGDVPLRFSVDLKAARSALRRLSSRVNRTAGRADLDVDKDGHVVLRGGDGVALAVEGSVLRVREALESRPPQARVELVVARMSTHAGGDERLATLQQMRYVLASFSTPYDAGIRGRTNNLRMAAALVNGEIVQSDAVFSTNQAIGPRNAAAGWREAKMFVDGQVVTGVGAGICQCSSTIYNAALLAGLPIVERHQHMFRVSYAKPSRDAAIYWGQKDMRFRNDTSGPIYVQTWLEGGRFRVRLYGVEPPRAQVEIVSRTLSRSDGTRSEAFRVMKTSNGTTKQRLSRDFYKPHP